MKILMMTNTYLPIVGGLEKSIKTFSDEFRKLGHKVKIVAPDFEGAPESEAGVIRLPAVQNFNKTDFSVQIPVPGLLEKLFKAYLPDVVHAHHPFLVGDLALRLSRKYNVPLVFTYHTMFEQYTNYFALDNESVRAFVMKLAAGYANLADQVIVPSESIEAVLKKRGVKRPIRVVPTGFDIEKFAVGRGEKTREDLGIKPEAFVLGHVGRLSEEKNLGFLTEAVSVFLVQNPDAVFLVGGKGRSREKMEKTFEACGVSGRVKFAGVLNDEALVNAYHAMDLFAFASLSETQGMVVTEAMSAGVPVVGVDAPGVREVIRDGENGFLTPSAELALFVKALGDYKQLREAEKKSFSQAARRTAAFFSAGRCAQKALEVYEAARAEAGRKKPDAAPWERMMNQIKTEWDLFANISKATGEAIQETLLQD